MYGAFVNASVSATQQFYQLALALWGCIEQCSIDTMRLSENCIMDMTVIVSTRFSKNNNRTAQTIFSWPPGIFESSFCTGIVLSMDDTCAFTLSSSSNCPIDDSSRVWPLYLRKLDQINTQTCTFGVSLLLSKCLL